MRTPVLALDLGTSSVRAIACDDRAEPIPSVEARRSVPPRQDASGAGELDPDAYLRALCECLDELQAAGSLDQVEKVATSSQWHSVLALDSRGRAASFALTWLDTRAPATAKPGDADAYHRRTGSWVHPLYWTTKIPWLGAELSQPGLRFTGITEYLRDHLLGSPVISVSMASGSGMLDVESACWHDESIDLAGIRAADLPEISDQPARLKAEFARRWPALADAEWTPATGDGATSTVGAGCAAGVSAGVTVGTSAAIRVAHDVATAPPLDAALWRYRVDANRMLTGAAVSSGGVLHEWLTGLLGEVVEPTAAPGVASAGLSVVPMHAGSRPPVALPAGSGVVSGFALSTRPDELVAATYEGVVFELQRSLTLLDRSFDTTNSLSVVLGGGAVAASAWWRRAFAAAFDRDVRYQVHPEVGARGAAMLALGIEPTPPDTALATSPDEVASMRSASERYADVRARMLAGR